jgi:tetratricopeptide (TPR) repeat protein
MVGKRACPYRLKETGTDWPVSLLDWGQKIHCKSRVDTMRRSAIASLLLILVCHASIAAAPTAQTVLGANPELADGSVAMMQGDWQRGIELTQSGLNSTVSIQDRAAGLANLCAAHAALKRFEQALDYCTRSIALSDANWRTWQNRAACYLALGYVELALKDLERGLALNPDSDALQKTLAIAREQEKLQHERLQQLIES